jgi:hypothetical protein
LNCDLILNSAPAAWVDDYPFLLWEVGPKRVIEHWVDMLFEFNGSLNIWAEEPHPALVAFVNNAFPLSKRCRITLGKPGAPGEACTFLEDSGALVARKGGGLTGYLPDQPAARSWFAHVRHWLSNLQSKGTHTPELEREIAPGVFIEHHCLIAPGTNFQAPCWVGSGAMVRGGTIGPFAVIGEHAVISDGAHISSSAVLSRTFIGGGLRLEGMVAGSNRILEHQTGTMVSIPDRSLIRSIGK